MNIIDLGQKVRIAIYAVIVFSLMLGIAAKLIGNEPIVVDKECFWPPDMVPHPIPPGEPEPPYDPNDPDNWA